MALYPWEEFYKALRNRRRLPAFRCTEGPDIDRDDAESSWQRFFQFTRYFAPSVLIRSNDLLSDELIKLTANPSHDKGGICFGDSGGPDILSLIQRIVAIRDRSTEFGRKGSALNR